jgi:hypothetical protein
MTMYPLSFEEYIDYFGGYEYYKEHSISTICTEKYQWFQDLYSGYLKVGGYPEIFRSYMDGKQLDMQFETLLDSFKSELRTRSAEICDFDKIDNNATSIKNLLQNHEIDFAILVKRNAKTGEKGNIYTLPIFLVPKFTFDKGKAIKEDKPKRMEFFQ